MKRIYLWYIKRQWRNKKLDGNWQVRNLTKYGIKIYCLHCRTDHLYIFKNGNWVNGKAELPGIIIDMFGRAMDILIDDYRENTLKKMESVDYSGVGHELNEILKDSKVK